MSTRAVPRDLQLPPSQRTQSAFREQRKEKLKEHLLRRKTLFASKQENQILSSQGQRITSKNLVQREAKGLKLKAEMDNKENIGRPTGNKNNVSVGKNCIPLKPSKGLISPSRAVDAQNLEDNNQTLPLPLKDDTQGNHMTLSQAFHLKNHSKKKQTILEKPKQEASIPKKPVLGSYRGQIVQSKIDSFRKPLQVKDVSSGTATKLSTAASKVPTTATEPRPVGTDSVAVKNGSTSHVRTATKSVNAAAQPRPLVRPPIRSHQENQDPRKQGVGRISSSVAVQRGPREKALQLNAVVSGVKASDPHIKQSRAPSKSTLSATVAKPASSFNSKLMEKSKPTDQRRHTIAKATLDGRLTLPKETAEERKARLNEWRTGKGRVLKRPPHSVNNQPEQTGQNENPVASFWTTMAEEDEQRLFTEKVNRTLSECLNLIEEGCPREEVLTTLNDLIKNIPEAKKLVRYWICLARLEPVTSPIENVITIYEQAILAGAQPIEEMRQLIVGILTAKSEEKVKLGESNEAFATKEEIQEVSVEDTSVEDPDSEKPEMENKHHGDVVFQDCKKSQDVKTKEPDSDKKTPNTETRASCLIKYNVSTTPYLQSVKKIQLDETNSPYKELKFLTPVRRSRRIQEKTAQLPDMLKDHYPCVSSLEQLRELGKETDAFVCRPNAALCGMFLEPVTEK
ncbi:cytoskeleton-associated protein 2 isoform X1 [Sorex fumeus]|uniref:cytoskeleton-associated protein 2 isoform X1 n=1 Tax=Sorex fumeus TaxID=62283 RepID=UPI0024AD4FAD|nr:cytoskeleton-associated protein 2 isoform X1 [Sorex fumeus]